MDIKSIQSPVSMGVNKASAPLPKKENSFVKDSFQKAKDAGSFVGDKMKDAVTFIRTKSDTNRAVSTLFGLATIGVGLAGLATVGTFGMPVLAHLGLTLGATMVCSYMSHRFA